jgi:endonuclease/exonuclease/phosphatase family metal-dependent hydrolase
MGNLCMNAARFSMTWLSYCLIAIVGQTAAADPPNSWTSLGTLSAPEAHQAAAADDRFVYAITNTQVARYDRETGLRVAISTGPALHLNSGFLADGKLYCAHSNFPQTPEQSEIKVLDLATMQLTTFKDFGNFGGSLTWAVQRQDRWWCNFARYGDDNAHTFLVEFDANWRELRRWVYPPQLIRQLGRNSLSGGIWDGNDLLVTGHDDPVIFRLRLPAQGSDLELLGAELAPFTGQGIARDPRTGGLVGIHRAKKQVLFAARVDSGRPQLRVLSYNIHHGEGIDRKLDLPRIAQVILSAAPDLVSLQEVDRRVMRTESVDQPTELGRLTGMQVVFGGNITLQGGDYGNAILSRFPVIQHKNHLLPCLDNGEQRGVLVADIQPPGWDHRLQFLATHLDHRRPNAERLASAATIAELIAGAPNQPALLAGDLNDTPESAVLQSLRKQWTPASAIVLPTIPVDRPDRQIDYIVFKPAGRWRLVEARVLEESQASDHRPIFAVLEYVADRK